MSDPKRWWPESEEEMMDAEEGAYSPPAPKTCGCCGTSDLHWGSVLPKAGGKSIWSLFSESGLHVCPVASLPQVIKMANGSTIRAAKTVDAVRGYPQS